ncbi:MAG: hypothetical protein RLZZ175_2557 [Bacteroidota bacterium]
MMKQQFILDELWMLTINASFQRANVYKDDVDEKLKKEFKIRLRECVVDISNKYIDNEINDNEHIENIKLLSAFTQTFSNILNNDNLNFGVCQKMLNLYLKYLWTMNLIQTPPHFPVDRIIQQKLELSPYPWTQMTDETEYLKVIQKAKEYKAKENKKYEYIAELELDLFNRRSIL